MAKPESASRLNWGILGCGAIAHKFALGLESVPDAHLLAVAARELPRAQVFAERWHAPRAYGSYDALLADPDIDLVYVAVIHPEHHRVARLALEAGKHVLLEKPFTINAEQAADLIALANDKQRFLMEAMWTRFNPISQQVARWVAEGRIGRPLRVRASFGYDVGTSDEAREGRALKRELGGGALLDVGIYTLAFAGLVLGYEPTAVHGVAELDEVTGADRVASVQLQYASGAVAELTSAVGLKLIHEGEITGTVGRIVVPRFWDPREALLCKTHEVADDSDYETLYGIPESAIIERHRPEIAGNAYGYEAAEAMRCVRAGLLESPEMSHAETLAWMRVMDGLRDDWGLDYGEAEEL